MYLGSGCKQYSDHRVQPLLVGEDAGYCDNLKVMLARIPEPYVICWVEDRIISAPVNTAALVSLVRQAASKGAGYLKLIPEHPIAYGSKLDFDETPLGTSYRVSMTVALWKKQVLAALLRSGESAWDLERRGSIRSNAQKERYFALSPKWKLSPPISHVHVIVKGKIVRPALAFLLREGLTADLAARRVEPWRSYWYARCYHWFFGIVRPIQAFILHAFVRLAGRNAIDKCR